MPISSLVPRSSGKALRSRLSLLLLLTIFVTAISGCGLFDTHKKVQVPLLLTPLADASTNQLMGEVNRLAAVNSVHGKVDILFEDTSFAEQGVADKYRQADGTLTVQRPGNIYLIIEVPFIATHIAQMTSDGQSFRVAVLQGEEKYKRFVKGTNNAVYQKLDMDGAETDPGKKKKKMTGMDTVNALSNLRPQHLTEAFMISPVLPPRDTGMIYSKSEFFQEEPDTRPQAKKNSRVVRGYFLLEEMSAPTSGESRLLRRFWFDRVGGIRLTRIQTFDERAQLITDVAYLDDKAFGANAVKLPSRIDITRPHDHYRLSITYQSPTSVDIDREFRPEAFVLENRWKLPEVDLDARRAQPTPINQ
ncbi:MAG: hypothetical protein ACR2H6_03515 [Pyrinomonadaceae bacterium]